MKSLSFQTFLLEEYQHIPQEIYEYIKPIIDEHTDAIKALQEAGYRLSDAHMREIMLEWGRIVSLEDSENFADIQNMSGAELNLVIVFLHPQFEQFDGIGSIIRLELSHHTMSGMSY